jgi:NTP pyrophosphatase (non-canonical NTP hydrolase)
MKQLRILNALRQKEWDPSDLITLTYRATELAGELGEACNVIKKLERERLGIRGSRDTLEHLAEELADVIICADLIAMSVNIDLNAAVIKKFNATSDAMGLKTHFVGDET